MGMIRITTWGSLRDRSKDFGPADHGHAQLVADAIEWMTKVVLQDAIAQDAALAAQGSVPPKGWPSRRGT